MVRHIDAIFTKGAFLPVEELTLPEGTRVHLRVEEDKPSSSVPRVRTPRLANPNDVARFVMEVRESDDADL